MVVLFDYKGKPVYKNQAECCWGGLVFVFPCMYLSLCLCVFCKTLIRVVVLYDREGEPVESQEGEFWPVAAMPAAHSGCHWVAANS